MSGGATHRRNQHKTQKGAEWQKRRRDKLMTTHTQTHTDTHRHTHRQPRKLQCSEHCTKQALKHPETETQATRTSPLGTRHIHRHTPTPPRPHMHSHVQTEERGGWKGGREGAASPCGSCGAWRASELRKSPSWTALRPGRHAPRRQCQHLRTLHTKTQKHTVKTRCNAPKPPQIKVQPAHARGNGANYGFGRMCG